MCGSARSRLLLLVLFLLVGPRIAAAQTLREDLLNLGRAGAIGGAMHSFSVFGGVPGISAATYDSDGLHLDSYKVPLSHSFAPIASGWLAGTAPYVELTAGYLHARDDTTVTDAALGSTDARLTFDAITVLAGVGLDIPILEDLGGKTILRPILLAGYAYISSNTRFSGPNASAIATATQGLLTDVSLNSLLLGGAIALTHERSIWGDVTLMLGLRFNQLVDTGLHASDSALNTTNGFSVATAVIELKGPTGIEVAGRALRWITFASGTGMYGRNSDALGFSSFAELGAGLELAGDLLIPGVEAVSLRGSGLFGDNVTGWSVGLAFSF
ncbi:hypothetical protein KPL78_18230 [Roseomonas sp. HJA6]|uniref:Autotransporter outer membrane beta-barrel domain-containing protein n=1 Tax=Roseomonas alba TaxID=2846776 RepID=A0ABS7ABX3_9PROT|nr:hypothetical protein [Neoroseomonas alba]MBW6399802.1 hypothetical protein [Neoroseomonas alba]